MLDAEAERLAAGLIDSTNTLEAMQMHSAEAACEVADELPALRTAFRKRCRAGFSNAVRFACQLSVLEAELHGGGGDACGGGGAKRVRGPVAMCL